MNHNLNVIELQGCDIAVTEDEVYEYFSRMDGCALIVGALQLKSPTYGFEDSSLNPDRQNMMQSMQSISTLRRSERIMNIRKEYEKRAIAKVMENMAIFLAPDNLVNQASEIDRLLKEQFERTFHTKQKK